MAVGLDWLCVYVSVLASLKTNIIFYEYYVKHARYVQRYKGTNQLYGSRSAAPK